jgi:glutamate 5-kinase
VRAPKRIVVKLGTGVLTAGGRKLDERTMASVCAQMAALRKGGTEVYVVSSGAVGLGMGTLGLARRPRDLGLTQACAAIGQSKLMQTWQSAFEPHGVTVAQVLLTHDDLRIRARYLGVRETLQQLIACGAVPVINENDAVSAAELKVGAGLRFGDNDTLSAMVASVVGADYLVILSTAEGLVDFRGTGKVVSVIERITPEIEAMAGGTHSETSVGGMLSKISAARLATGRARHPAPPACRRGPGIVLRPERAAARRQEALARLFPAADRNPSPECTRRDPAPRGRAEPSRRRSDGLERRLRRGRRRQHRRAGRRRLCARQDRLRKR